MGKGGGGSAPAMPDPYKTADAQAKANIDTAIAQTLLNQTNQVTPWGSVTYRQLEGTGPTYPGYDEAMSNYNTAMANYNAGGGGGYDQAADPFGLNWANNRSTGASSMPAPVMPNRDDFKVGSNVPQFEQIISLDPTQQRIFDNASNLKERSQVLAGDILPLVRQANTTPMDFSGMPEMLAALDYSRLPQGVGAVQAGPMVMNVGANDFSADRQRVEDALVSRMKRQYDPIFADRENAMRTQLANEGITRGSEAFTGAYDDFNRNRSNVEADIIDRAILAGGNEQSRLFGMDLSKGQFANQAQAQEFSQGMGNAQLANSLRGQMTQEQALDAQIREAARKQAVYEDQLKRTLPLQIAQALQQGTSPMIPQAPQAPQSSIAAPNIQGAVQNNYNSQLAQWQQGQQANNAAMGSLFGLGGSILGASMGGPAGGSIAGSILGGLFG